MQHKLESSLLQVYNRINLDIDYGKGSYIYSKNKDIYLDFVSGVAVNCLGHCHPKLVATLKNQAEKLWHISNIFEIPGMEELGQLLIENSFARRVFFCNSGAEAIECCIKAARRYHDVTGNPDKYRIITFTGAFHGRTLAALFASKRDQFMQEGFGPAIEGFDHVEFNDIEAVKKIINPQTAAILIEPIQGDGGIRVANQNFLKSLRKLCDEHNLLLCFDEIQCGVARTGSFYAHEQYGVIPDIMTSAKGIGGGFPLGACLFSQKASQAMGFGTHGSTYGGNPLAMAVGKAVIEEVLQPSFMNNVKLRGEQLKNELLNLQQKYTSIIKEVRGMGLLLGLQLVVDNKLFNEKLLKNKLLTVGAGENTTRLLPPLNIGEKEIFEAINALDKTCKEF